MAYDKVVDSIQLETAITETADAIRAKTGNTDPIAWVANKGFADVISLITSGGKLIKVGTILSAYQQNTLDIKNTYSKYADITVNDIYLVPDTFTITKDGTITGGTYNLNKTYDASTGILTAWRDSIKGEVGLDFNCDVYVYGDIGENNGSGGLNIGNYNVQTGSFTLDSDMEEYSWFLDGCKEDNVHILLVFMESCVDSLTSHALASFLYEGHELEPLVYYRYFLYNQGGTLNKGTTNAALSCGSIIGNNRRIDFMPSNATSSILVKAGATYRWLYMGQKR